VADFNSATGNYTGNAYLSNHIETNEIQETPGIAITKSYYKGLSNRYDRNLSLSVNVKQRLTYQDNKSDRSFQNLSRSYSNFVPSASINYYGHEYGDHSNQVNLNFDTDLQVPTIDQLAPLIDSTNLYNIRKGNLNLREAETRRLSLSFYHTQEGTVNTLNYSGSVNFDFGNNAIVDSTFIDEQNRRMLFFTNADGYRSVTMRASARKALKFKTDALQINLSGTSSFTRNPGYINSVFSFSNNGNNSADLGLNYTHRDKLALEARQNISFYSSRQNAFNTNYSGKNATTTMSGSYNATKKFTLSSNINFNTNRSSGSPAINYNIWNASAIYRFLKGSNAELKFSALDLLHQNSNIINTGNANSFTIATRNVLQQYFMTTFSYYPRQFGKNTGKK
jgi:hypothetical protein